MKPIVHAMLICDYYYRDVSGKGIIAGTFSSINCGDFPAHHGNCAVYISLSDVATTGVLQLTFRREMSEFSMQLPPWQITPPDDRRTVIEIGGNINGLFLPEEGAYEFVLSWDGMEIASRRLLAARIPQEMP